MKNGIIYKCIFYGIVNLCLLLLILGCQSVRMEPPPVAHNIGEIDHPWSGCGKGSFIHYKIMRPTDGVFVEQRQTVVDTQPDKVLMETATLVNDEWRSEGVMELLLTPLEKPASELKLTEQVLGINGRDVQCKVVERILPKGDKATIARDWMSKEVPGGLVRKDMAGKVVWEVIDFGKK